MKGQKKKKTEKGNCVTVDGLIELARWDDGKVERKQSKKKM